MGAAQGFDKLSLNVWRKVESHHLHKKRSLCTGAAHTRAAEQGPPRSEGCVPLPESRSDSREGGRRAAPQGDAPNQASTIIRDRISRCSAWQKCVQ